MSPIHASNSLADTLGESLIWQWLPNDQGRLTVSQLGELRRSDIRSDAFEIECLFESNRGPLRGWAPFEQLGQLASGAVFDRGEFVGLTPSPKRLTTQKLVAEGTATLEALGVSDRAASPASIRNFRLSDLTPIALEPWGQRHEEPPMCLAEDTGRQVFIASGELLRFYFGPLSLGANAFMAAAAQDPGEDLADFDLTAFVDEDVFRVAPNEALLDRGSALHLAMLLASPDLCELWTNTTLGLTLAHARGYPQYPVVVLPSAAGRLRLEGHDIDVHTGMLPVARRAFRATRILSDERTPPFKKLIIRLPRGSPGDLAGDELELPLASERRKGTLMPDLVVDNRQRPGLSGITRSTLFQSMLAAFPGFASVKIAYEHAPARRTAPQVASETPVKIDTLSTLPILSGGEAGALRFRPNRLPDPQPPPPNLAAQTLLRDKNFDEARVVSVAIEQLSFPIPTFVYAFSALRSTGVGSLLFQNPTNSLANQIALLEAPATWLAGGRFSKARRVAVGMMLVDERPTYAFELERWSRHERISLFLATRTDGQTMSRSDLSAIFRYAVLRLADRSPSDQNRGVWPVVGYSDVVGRTVAHKARRLYARCLAEDLDDLSRVLGRGAAGE